MFTGIVQAVGAIERLQIHGRDTRIGVHGGTLALDDVAIGDSICVSGVCLTVIALDRGGFAADVSVETLSRTTLGTLRVGSRVNLEKSLRLADRLGGHLVAGHVDGIARVVAVQPDARSQRWQFEIDPLLARYVVAKGSICLDGVSLTVNEVDANRFGVNLIPHTIDMTAFGDKGVGDAVNVETDLIARYVERLLNREM
jgi:riboflavin synthase